jgi:ribonuclease T2
MKKRSVIVLLSLLLPLAFLPLAACNPKPKPVPEPVPRPHATAFAAHPSTTQNFDYYLLNLSWSPEFCHSHPNATECSQHAAFVLHGLWPQNNNGTYPQDCSAEPAPGDPAAFNDLYPDPGLLNHEWRTHGTCSGLSPDAFFTLARNALHSVAIPTELKSLDHQISRPPMEILSLFSQTNPSFPRDSFALSCGNNYLTAIEVCMNKTLQPIACGSIRSCRANTVRIAPPQRS